MLILFFLHGSPLEWKTGSSGSSGRSGSSNATRRQQQRARCRGRRRCRRPLLQKREQAHAPPDDTSSISSSSRCQHQQRRRRRVPPAPVMAAALVRGHEAGANLKLISRQLKGLSKGAADSSYVCVGDTIEAEEPDYLKGHGTALVDGRLAATVCGTVQRINKLIYVAPVKSRYTPEVGDVVVGRVTEIAGKRWKIDLHSKQEAGLLISAVNLPGGVQRRRNAEDELNMRAMFREGDLISAEVQGKNSDGGIQLHTRSAKFGKLSGGQLVAIHATLVRKQRFHFTTLPGLDVDVISGLNGLIWVSPHIPRGEDGAPLQPAADAALPASLGGNPAALQAAAAAAGGGPTRPQREAVVRVAGAVRALAALMLQVYPDAIVSAYKASLENGVAVRDMCERPFLELLAAREVKRRQSEAAQALVML